MAAWWSICRTEGDTGDTVTEPDRAEAAAPAIVAATVTSPVHTLLIVDDSRMVRASIIKHIRGRYPFREESNGEAAWLTLQADPSISLVISDLSMPRLDGYGLLERIRGCTDPRLRSLPIIMISGDEETEARAKAIALGATDFIAKGIGTPELLARLERALTDSTARAPAAPGASPTPPSAPTDAAPTERAAPTETPALPTLPDIAPALPPSAVESLPAAPLTWATESLTAPTARAEPTPGFERESGLASALVVGIDRYAEIGEHHGEHVAALVARKLAKILATKVRTGDAVTPIGEGLFSVLILGLPAEQAGGFAQRLRAGIAGLNMQYRGERLRIRVSVGVANSERDGLTTLSELIALALERARAAMAEGGDRVRTSGRMADPRTWTTELVSVERALALLQAGATDEVRDRLPELLARLLPLLALAEQTYRLTLPLAELKERIRKAL